jgi:hypothetical protein
LILHEVIAGQNLLWVLDEDSGVATRAICEEAGAVFNGPLPPPFQKDQAVLADFVLPRQSANLRARLAHVGATA